MRKIRNRPEQALHLAVASFLNVALPRDSFFFHVPNAAVRSLVEGGIFKRMATRAGVPDLIILYQGRAYAIELKADKGELSEAQIETHTAFARAGIPVAVCKSLEGVEEALRSWGFELRASLSKTQERKAA